MGELLLFFIFVAFVIFLFRQLWHLLRRVNEFFLRYILRSNNYTPSVPRGTESTLAGYSPNKSSYNLNYYHKKRFLFDTPAEFHFFSLLDEIVGTDYCIFPQVNYAHIITVNVGSFFEDRRYRSHIERKSADFVICDRETCVPRLVINVDGSIHRRPDVIARDNEIDEILSVIGLPILRLTNEQSRRRETVREKVLPFLL